MNTDKMVVSTNYDLATFDEFMAELKNMRDERGTPYLASTNPLMDNDDMVLIIPLEANNNKYQVDIDKGVSVAFSKLTEQLEKGHVFFVTGVRIGIRKFEPAARGNDGNYSSYASPRAAGVFIGANGAITEEKGLRVVYNSKFILKTENLERYKVNTAVFENEFVGSTLQEKGYVNVFPRIILQPESKNEAIIEMTAGNTDLIAGGVDAANAAVTPLTNNAIEIRLRGFRFRADGGSDTSGHCVK